MSAELTAIDLFSGAGGVTAGLKAANFRVLAAIENDPNACATYSANHEEVSLFPLDIAEVDPQFMMKSLDLVPGKLGLLTACAPCQGFSTLGRRRSDDPRNDLLLAVLPFVETFMPKTLAFENVPRLQADARFTTFLAKLRDLGYGVRDEPLDAADYSVPQRRRRLVALAWHEASDEEIPELEKDAEPPSPVWVRHAWSTLSPIDEADALHVSKAYPADVLARIKAIPKDGGSRSDLPDHLQLHCHRKIGNHASNVYGRMRWDDVAPTLTTRCTSPSCGRFLHPEEDRAITLREASLLQTFPIDYQFRGGRMSIEAQIGNAVPVMLARAIGLIQRRRLL